MTKPLCPKCGSDNVFFKADAVWNDERQCFVALIDDDYKVDCLACDYQEASPTDDALWSGAVPDKPLGVVAGWLLEANVSPDDLDGLDLSPIQRP